MSVRRSNIPRFVPVRGTMISTSKRNPSLLSIHAVRVLGLPNKDGTLIVDSTLLSVTYLDDHHISVWADVRSDPRIFTYELGWTEACAVM